MKDREQVSKTATRADPDICFSGVQEDGRVLMRWTGLRAQMRKLHPIIDRDIPDASRPIVHLIIKRPRIAISCVMRDDT